MAWQSEYNGKLVSAEEAISHLKSGDSVYVGHSMTTAYGLVHEMCRQKDRLRDVKIYNQNPLGELEYMEPGTEKHFHTTFLFLNGREGREAVADGRADFVSLNLSELPKLFSKQVVNLDVAFVCVAAPDADGYCSFGLGVSNNLAVMDNAKLVIAEVNENMPFIESAKIHVSKFDLFAPSDRPIVELPPPRIDEVSAKIGAHIAKLIPDGANLQIGFGSVPDAILKSLADKKDLGVHTEMFSDGVMELVEAGVITNKYNNLNPGKITTTYAAGSRELYKWLDHNPLVVIKPADYTNDIRVAGRVDNLHSINAALQVDLMGQVNAEMIGHKQFSGVGGQSDFVKSAMLSKGGKSFIALPSTAKNGQVSRIVARLDEGSCVTTTRHDVMYVATEFGVVDLYGKSLRERRELLISIAHPKFRDELRNSQL